MAGGAWAEEERALRGEEEEEEEESEGMGAKRSGDGNQKYK